MKKFLFFIVAVMATLSVAAKNNVAKTEIFKNKTLADMEAEFKSWEYPPTERAAMLKSSDFCIVSMVFGATQCRFIISYRTKDNKIVRLWIHSHDKYSDVIETQNGEYSLYASGDKLEIYKLPIERFIPIVSVDNWGKISVKGNFSWERL